MGNAHSTETRVNGTSRLLLAVMALGAIALLPGCGGGGGSSVSEIELPLDNALNLYCPDVGIADETCILDDPENPYARSIIDDDTKFFLAEDSPSAKSDFYLWGTAQAKSPRGENQYYTAVAMHRMYTQGGSQNAREQAKRAYRSALDNYFGDVTFYSFDLPEGELVIPDLIRDLVGENLVEPEISNFSQLYESQARAIEALGQWGYVYDLDTGFVFRIGD